MLRRRLPRFLLFLLLLQIVTKFHYTKVLKPEKLTHHTTIEVR